MTLEKLLNTIRNYHPNFDKSRITKAFFLVEEKNKIFCDDTGCRNFIWEVLDILFPIKPDEDTILAVLFHDFYLNSLIDEKTIKKSFGEEVVFILQGMKKLNDFKYNENDKSSQTEVVRKLFLTLAKDLRVVLIWLCWRLSIMRNMEFSSASEEKIVKFARENMDLYAPIASRLAFYRIKTQLEDLSFQYLNPDIYLDIQNKIEDYIKDSSSVINAMCKNLKKFLKVHNIEVEIQGRIKSTYSIYNKIKRKDYNSIDQVHDIFAIRVILPVDYNKKGDCSVDRLYSVLGLIHSNWNSLSHRFKDYIAVPKVNFYKSLHTVVLGLNPEDKNQPVEIQIRDEDMHMQAEFGLASHWFYKRFGNNSLSKIDSQIEWLKLLQEIHSPSTYEYEILKGVNLEIFKDRIFVLTPQGDVKDLPVDSTPVDFAYAIHTDIGNRCMMAKINGKAVSLDYKLKNGEMVDIVLKNQADPKLRWLSFTKTSLARQHIKAWFSTVNRGKMGIDKKEREKSIRIKN